MDRPPDKDPTGAQSVDRALRLLSMIGRQGERGLGLAEAVELSGINKPTVRRLLLALMRAGLVHQAEDDRRYHLGEEAYILGSLASPRFGLLRLAMPSLARLASKTADSTFLSVRRNTVAVCLHREEGTFPIRTHALQAGYEHPLGAGAGSLAMLAALPDGEMEAVMACNGPAMKERYPMLPPEELRRHVALARQRGYAVNPASSSPIPGASGSPSAIPTARSPARSASPPSTAACSRRARASSASFSWRRRPSSKARSHSSSTGPAAPGAPVRPDPSEGDR